jgi:hypothetical protein
MSLNENKFNVEDGLQHIHQYIVSLKKSPQSYSAKSFMELMDISFKICTMEKEEYLLKTVYNALQETKNLYLQELDLIQSNHQYVINNPVYPAEKNINNVYPAEKNINKTISDFAYPLEAEEYKRMLEFLMIVKTTQRIASFMCRFYLPNQSGKKDTMMMMDDGKTIYIPKSIVDLGYIIWPEIDYEKIKQYSQQ